MDMTDMLLFTPKNMPPLAEGEALFFTCGPMMEKTLSILCGVSGKPVPGVPPRILVCGGEPENCAEALRTAADTPVLFCTPDPSHFVPPPTTERYRVLGRPFLFDDLYRAVAELLAAAPLSPPSDGDVPPPRLHVERCSAVSDGIRVPLTPCEAAILKVLTDAYPEAATREALAGVFARQGSNTVSVYVTYLRRKLAAIPAFQGILSLRGGGFALVLRRDPNHNESR